MSPERGGGYRLHTCVLGTEQSRTHPHFLGVCLLDSGAEMWRVFTALPPNQQHSRSSENKHPTIPHKTPCILHDDAPAPVSFHPGSRQISVMCAERAACGSTGWFFKGFTGLTGLFPSECGGIVSFCCTWASRWLRARTRTLLKKPEKQALFFLLGNMTELRWFKF